MLECKINNIIHFISKYKNDNLKTKIKLIEFEIKKNFDNKISTIEEFYILYEIYSNLHYSILNYVCNDIFDIVKYIQKNTLSIKNKKQIEKAICDYYNINKKIIYF